MTLEERVDGLEQEVTQQLKFWNGEANLLAGTKRVSPELGLVSLQVGGDSTKDPDNPGENWGFVNWLPDDKYKTEISQPNLLPMSGTFQEKGEHIPYKLLNFVTKSMFFLLRNGATVEQGGEFRHNNSTYGGTAAPISVEVEEMLTALGVAVGVTARRYGTSFHSAKFTAGTGTNSPTTVGSDTYYLCIQAGFGATYHRQAGGRRTFAFATYVEADNEHALASGAFVDGVYRAKNYVLTTGAHLIVIESAGQTMHMNWHMIRSKPGAVLHICCPILLINERVRAPWKGVISNLAYDEAFNENRIEALEETTGTLATDATSLDAVVAGLAENIVSVTYPEAHYASGTDWTTAVNAALLEAANATPRKGIKLSQIYDVSSIDISGANGNVPAFIQSEGGGFRAITADVNLLSLSNPHAAGVNVFEIRGSLELNANSLATHALHVKGIRRLTGAIRTFSARSHGAMFQSDAGFGIYYSDFSIDGAMHGGDGVHMYSSEDDPDTPTVDEAYNRIAANTITIISHFCRGRGLFMSHAQNNILLTAEQCVGVGVHIEKVLGTQLNIVYEEHCGDRSFATPYGDTNFTVNSSGTDVALYLAKNAYNVKVQGARVIGIDTFEDCIEPSGYSGYHR